MLEGWDELARGASGLMCSAESVQCFGLGVALVHHQSPCRLVSEAFCEFQEEEGGVKEEGG